MKTVRRINERRSTVVFFLILFLIIGLYASGNAQVFRNYYSPGKPNLSIAVEGGIAMRTFTIKSDLAPIRNLKAVEEGWSAGLTVGGKNLRGRFIFGNYDHSSTVAEDVSQTTYTCQLNFYPLSILGVKSKYFKPYFFTAIDINRIKFFGTFLEELENEKAKEAAEKSECTCSNPDHIASSSASGGTGAPGNPGSNPDTSTDQPGSLEPRHDALTAHQGMVGMGMECSFKKGGRMFSMFSEAKYGFQMCTNTLSRGLVNTSISNQLSVYFGVAIGLSKNNHH